MGNTDLPHYVSSGESMHFSHRSMFFLGFDIMDPSTTAYDKTITCRYRTDINNHLKTAPTCGETSYQISVCPLCASVSLDLC